MAKDLYLIYVTYRGDTWTVGRSDLEYLGINHIGPHTEADAATALSAFCDEWPDIEDITILRVAGHVIENVTTHIGDVAFKAWENGKYFEPLEGPVGMFFRDRWLATEYSPDQGGNEKIDWKGE